MRTSGNKKTSRAARQLRRRGLHLALLAVGFVFLQANECTKDDFYDPFSNGIVDDVGPLISNLQPAPNAILNDVMIMATITDPQGSGADESSITATGDDGADLPITAAGANMYNADIADWGDGLRMVTWSALDLAGNEGTASQTFTIDRTAPQVEVDPAPPTSVSSDDAQFSWTVGIDITEPHFLDASYRVTLAGADEECGTGDDVMPTAEQVPTSTFPLDEGSNSVEVVANNGVEPGGEPRTAFYCGQVTARDAAVTKAGTNASNTTTTPSFRTELEWLPPTGGGDFMVGLGDLRWEHTMPGVESLECKIISTSPAQAGATWSATVNGPTEGGASGVISGQTFGGTLDANGRAELRVRINRFGTYVNNVTVTAGSVTRNATASVTVGSAANTCVTLPSSMRFKRGVVALLPDDVRPLGLNPVAFRYLEPWGDPSIPRIGLIAEEVAEAYPRAVLRDAEGRPNAIDYRALTQDLAGEATARASVAARAGIRALAEAL